MDRPDSQTRRVPPRALALSVAALAVPTLAAFFAPEALQQYAPFLWLLALLPAFLLAYYRGWKGVATALAAGMATLSLTQAIIVSIGRQAPDLLMVIATVYLIMSLGIGWLSERMLRDRGVAEEMANTDMLTHLPNRRHARLFLDNEFAAAQRGRLLTVVLFDLDRFKAYNDSYGHQAGDEALEAFGGVLARLTRRMNLSARIGGEEFLSILAGSDADGSSVFADRVRTGTRALNLGDPPLTVSAGIASYHPAMASVQELLAAADQALYQAKGAGRDCLRIFGRSALPGAEDRDASAARAGATPAKSQTPDFGVGRSLLLVEEDPKVRELLTTALRQDGFEIRQADSVGEGVQRLRTEFDALITNIRLPGAQGREIVSAAKSRWPDTQVIVITGLQDAKVAAAALNAGADRYLFKPFGIHELRAHLAEALAHRDRTRADRAARPQPDPGAAERDSRVREAVLRGARALARAVEARDPYTAGHSARVAAYAAVLADGLDPEARLLDRASLALACELHDVGKIGVPDAVLNKATDLDAEEFSAVKVHPRTGRRILEPLFEDELILAVVGWHHEHWDGTGYPDGLAGEAIPLPARLVAVAVALDAMTSPRAYRPARTWEEAAEEIRERAGTQFAPRLVDVFERVLAELTELSGRLLVPSPVAPDG